MIPGFLNHQPYVSRRSWRYPVTSPRLNPSKNYSNVLPLNLQTFVWWYAMPVCRGQRTEGASCWCVGIGEFIRGVMADRYDNKKDDDDDDDDDYCQFEVLICFVSFICSISIKQRSHHLSNYKTVWWMLLSDPSEIGFPTVCLRSETSVLIYLQLFSR